MEFEFQTDVAKCIGEVRSTVDKFEEKHQTRRKDIHSELNRTLTGLIPDLICIIHDYAILICPADVCAILGSGVDTTSLRPWIRNVMVVAIATDDIALFETVNRMSSIFVEINEKEGVPAFGMFRSMPFHIPPRNRFGQLLTNLICYCGKGDLKWLTKFFQDETSISTGTLLYGPYEIKKNK